MKAFCLSALLISASAFAAPVKVTHATADEFYKAECMVIIVPQPKPDGSFTDPVVVAHKIVNVPKGGSEVLVNYGGYDFKVSYYDLQDVRPAAHVVGLSEQKPDESRPLAFSLVHFSGTEAPGPMLFHEGLPEFECQDIIGN